MQKISENARIEVAKAIGRVVAGGEVQPVKNWLKAADAAIAAYVQGDWQPIETASKDTMASNILLCNGKSTAICEWYKDYDDNDRQYWRNIWSHEEYYGAKYWMPIRKFPII